MKIASWNVNGIRAVERKGELGNYVKKSKPDIIFFQEIKAKEDQLEFLREKFSHYDQFYYSAEKPGYAGTGVWVHKSQTIKDVQKGLPTYPNDNEGRIISVFFGAFVFLGGYFPNGGKSSQAWSEKIIFYNQFLLYINQLRESGKKVIWTGDINCAHNEIDLARPGQNINSIGFLPEERSWISRCIDAGWVDVFREKNPEKIQYSWWSMQTRARERNVGWRIDYFFCDQKILSKIKTMQYQELQKGSDHCPLEIIIDM